MDTFELLPSLAQGELAETSAPELVAAVFRSRASGTLWMEPEESNEIRCFFRAGDMCGSGAFKGFQTLAHVLLANEWVDALDIDSSSQEAQGSGRRHGEVLVEKGLLTPEQLRTALAAQHTANLTTMLQLTQGRYDWRGWEPPPPWAREVTVDPVACLVTALEQDMHAPRRKKVLDWLGNHAARLSLDWPELQGRVSLEPLDRRAAALLALPRRLEEFVNASRLPQTRAESLLVALLLAGGAEPQPQPASAPPPPQPVKAAPAQVKIAPVKAVRAQPKPVEPEPVEPEPLEPEPVEAEPLLDPLPERASQPEPELLADPEPELAELSPEPVPALFPDPAEHSQPQGDPFAEQHHESPQARGEVDESEALKRLDALSIEDPGPAQPPLAPVEESLEIDVQRAGPARAGGNTASVPHGRDEVTFDPDGHSAEDERNRELRKKLMSRGLRNLGGQPIRSDVEGGVLEESHDPAQAGEQPVSSDAQRFIDEVRSRARLAPAQNAYARLGVSPAVPHDHLKQSYLTLAKRFHPDRASSPEFKAVLPELQALFGLLKEAWDNVATPDLRKKYDEHLKAGGGGGGKPSTRKEEAVMTLKMGEVLFKKRDFEGAIGKLRRSVDLDANGDALAALAWVLVADPKGSPAQKEEAATLINRALRAPGVTARTYYVAGVLWRTKDPDSAVDAFRKALELDAHHSDAALELRLIEQRRGKQPPKTGGGVLSGLLFGKRKT